MKYFTGKNNHIYAKNNDLVTKKSFFFQKKLHNSNFFCIFTVIFYTNVKPQKSEL